MLNHLKQHFGSRRTGGHGGLDIARHIGPGLLVTVGFIDPGNWASNMAAGSQFGYALLWIVTLSTIMLIVLQHNAAHLGIATGMCLAEATTRHLPRLVGRAILGICVGGFWSLASAVTLQLVPTKDVPRALSIVYAGVSVATIIALPVASWIGHLIGWRNVFFLGALMAAFGFVWQYRALPSLPARAGSGFRDMSALLRRTWILAGIGGNILSFGGYHIFFTYLRPFLELDLALGANTLSVILLVFGVANVLGTFIAGALLGNHFRSTMILVHLAFTAAALALLLSQGHADIGVALAVFWGFAFGFTPVGWSTWIARTLSDKAELAGGLTVAATQFAIGLAAAVGGFTYDNLGINGIFLAAAGISVMAALLIAVNFSLFARDTGHKA